MYTTCKTYALISNSSMGKYYVYTSTKIRNRVWESNRTIGLFPLHKHHITSHQVQMLAKFNLAYFVPKLHAFLCVGTNREPWPGIDREDRASRELGMPRELLPSPTLISSVTRCRLEWESLKFGEDSAGSSSREILKKNIFKIYQEKY